MLLCQPEDPNNGDTVTSPWAFVFFCVREKRPEEQRGLTVAPTLIPGLGLMAG